MSHAPLTLGRILRQKHILRGDLLGNRDTLYVFGDNMARAGFGGQAKEMRGEPNAVGIPTKWAPALRPSAFFTNAAWADTRVRFEIRAGFQRLLIALLDGHNVVVPADGIGTGLADLAGRAPLVAAKIDAYFAALERYELPPDA